jgi:hypothetical protein
LRFLIDLRRHRRRLGNDGLGLHKIAQVVNGVLFEGRSLGRSDAPGEEEFVEIGLANGSKDLYRLAVFAFDFHLVPTGEASSVDGAEERGNGLEVAHCRM